MSEEALDKKDTAKTKPAGKKKNRTDKKSITDHMIYRIGEILRNTPGFDKLPKLKHFRDNHGKKKDNR